MKLAPKVSKRKPIKELSWGVCPEPLAPDLSHLDVAGEDGAAALLLAEEGRHQARLREIEEIRAREAKPDAQPR